MLNRKPSVNSLSVRGLAMRKPATFPSDHCFSVLSLHLSCFLLMKGSLLPGSSCGYGFLCSAMWRGCSSEVLSSLTSHQGQQHSASCRRHLPLGGGTGQSPTSSGKISMHSWLPGRILFPLYLIICFLAFICKINLKA